jgi:hypothetical protein
MLSPLTIVILGVLLTLVALAFLIIAPRRVDRGTHAPARRPAASRQPAAPFAPTAPAPAAVAAAVAAAERPERLPAGVAVKECPRCAETVLAAARICKHCRHRFAGWAELLRDVG